MNVGHCKVTSNTRILRNDCYHQNFTSLCLDGSSNELFYNTLVKGICFNDSIHSVRVEITEDNARTKLLLDAVGTLPQLKELHIQCAAGLGNNNNDNSFCDDTASIGTLEISSLSSTLLNTTLLEHLKLDGIDLISTSAGIGIEKGLESKLPIISQSTKKTTALDEIAMFGKVLRNLKSLKKLEYGIKSSTTFMKLEQKEILDTLVRNVLELPNIEEIGIFDIDMLMESYEFDFYQEEEEQKTILENYQKRKEQQKPVLSAELIKLLLQSETIKRLNLEYLGLGDAEFQFITNDEEEDENKDDENYDDAGVMQKRRGRTALKYLDLTGNNIQNKGVIAITKFFRLLQQEHRNKSTTIEQHRLIELNLCNNLFDSATITPFVEDLGIKRLYLAK